MSSFDTFKAVEAWPLVTRFVFIIPSGERNEDGEGEVVCSLALIGNS